MDNVIKTYAAYSLDLNERLDSSSGGIFSLLAKDILSSGGVVYGVALSDDCRGAEFIKVDDEIELEKLRTSKYLQAYVGNTYKLVKEDLENGRSVLFTGTGCQTNALVYFLADGEDTAIVREKFPNLYCQDVVCHGVPSPALWREYVDYIERQNAEKLVGVNFRCKNNSWVDFGMKKINNRHKEIYVSKDYDPYMLMFLRNYCLRPSCYECKAKKIKFSDITLADFWGIEKIVPEMSDGKGTSLVLIRTDKGKEIFERISREIVRKEVSYEDGVARNKAEYQSYPRPFQRDVFFEDMNSITFDKLKAKYGTPTPISLERKIKNRIKKFLLRYRWFGGV